MGYGLPRDNLRNIIDSEDCQVDDMYMLATALGLGALGSGPDLRTAILELQSEISRLRALNAALLADLERVVELGHYPDESIARDAIAKAKE